MSGSTFPPPGPTSLATIIPAYVYQQYSDDDNIQAFNSAFNYLAQCFYNWTLYTKLPIYTDASISGPLLDWTAGGIYGLLRPVLVFGTLTGVGPLNTWELNTIQLNTGDVVGSATSVLVNDDIFKRLITWRFFKGDGQKFTISWLKRRIMRFLIGVAGAAPNIDETYPVSITFGVNHTVLIVITLSTDYPISLATAKTFQAAVSSGVLNLPFQYTFEVSIVNLLPNSGVGEIPALIFTHPANFTAFPFGLGGPP